MINRVKAFLILTIAGGCTLFVLAYMATIPLLVNLGAVLCVGAALASIGLSWHNDNQKEDTK